MEDLGISNGRREIKIENGLESSEIVLPILDYKYVVVRDSENNILNSYTAENHQLAIVVPDGFNDVISIGFEEPGLWRFAEIISLLVLVFIIIVYISKGIKGKRNDTKAF